MRIRAVETLVLPLEMRATTVGKIPPMEWEGVFIRVHAEEGLAGTSSMFVLTSAAAQAEIIDRHLAPLLIGEDATRIEALWRKVMVADRLALGTATYAHGPVDIALWDLWGQISEQPVVNLLGRARDRVVAYASTLTYGEIAEYVDVVERLLEERFSALKLHCFGDPRRDIELCAAMRELVGEDVELMLDAAGAYGREDAALVGRALDELRFQWFEEPLPDSDLEGLRRLRDSIRTPLAGAETYQLPEYPTCLTSGAWDYLRPDAAFTRGVTAVRKVAAACEAFGVRCEIHSYGLALGQAANLHLMASIDHCRFFEMPVPVGLLDQGVVEGLRIDADGTVAVPQGHGLGLETDWEGVERAAIRRGWTDSAGSSITT